MPEQVEPSECCLYCHFSRFGDSSPAKELRSLKGDCCYNPPVDIVTQHKGQGQYAAINSSTYSRFPDIQGDQWCGRFMAVSAGEIIKRSQYLHFNTPDGVYETNCLAKPCKCGRLMQLEGTFTSGYIVVCPDVTCASETGRYLYESAALHAWAPEVDVPEGTFFACEEDKCGGKMIPHPVKDGDQYADMVMACDRCNKEVSVCQ